MRMPDGTEHHHRGVSGSSPGPPPGLHHGLRGRLGTRPGTPSGHVRLPNDRHSHLRARRNGHALHPRAHPASNGLRPRDPREDGIPCGMEPGHRPTGGPRRKQPLNLDAPPLSCPTGRLVSPYLNFDGRCGEAIAFYRETLGAEVDALMRFKDAPPSEGCTPRDPELIARRPALAAPRSWLQTAMARANPRLPEFRSLLRCRMPRMPNDASGPSAPAEPSACPSGPRSGHPPLGRNGSFRGHLDDQHPHRPSRRSGALNQFFASPSGIPNLIP